MGGKRSKLWYCTHNFCLVFGEELLTHHPRISGNTPSHPFKNIFASMRATKKVVPPPELTALLKYDGWFYGVYILGNGLSQTAVTGKDTLDKPTTSDRPGEAAGDGDVAS